MGMKIGFTTFKNNSSNESCSKPSEIKMKLPTRDERVGGTCDKPIVSKSEN
jgi:hypothetical protein